jgi:hypothetical protein
MLTPGDREFAGSAVAYGAGFGSPELTALTVALGRLVEASGGVANAVTHHDRVALVASNEKADGLVDEINGLAAALSVEDRAMLADSGVPALCRRLAVSARRNAYLIEHAWATDAALMRLLLGLGRVGPDGAVGGYVVAPGPTCVDRGA